MDEPLVSTQAIRNGRRKMEDKHVVIHDLNAQCNLNTQKRYSFYAVYDGHGGVDAANFCAENLHQILCKTRSFNDGNIEKALRETFKETDRLFCSSRFKTQSGCTAIVCLREFVTEPKQEVKLYFAWAGDSQAILVRDGSAIDVTPPHKPDDEKEITRIESLGGVVVKSDCYRVNGLLAVSRAIGDASHKPYITSEPDVRVETLTGAEDFMILACDGLWDEIDCDDATQLVYETIQDSSNAISAAKSVASCLVESAKNQGSADNITVIVIFLRPLREIFPTACFNNDSTENIVNNTKEEKEETTKLFGLEPVQLRAKKDGNYIQGYGEVVGLEGIVSGIAGDSMDPFKNGSVTYQIPTPTICREENTLPQDEEEAMKLPSPTWPCLSDSNRMTETMNSESPALSVPLSKLGEEVYPQPTLIKSEVESNTLMTTTSSPSSSSLVTPPHPHISESDLIAFSFSPRPVSETSQSCLEIPKVPDTPNVKEEMETKRSTEEIFSPFYSTFESKNEEVRIEEEFEETTVTTESVSDPIPMTRTSEKIFKAPSAVTSLLHEFSKEERSNGRSPSPTRESYSISSPSGNEKFTRVIGEFSNSDIESLTKKEHKVDHLSSQVKETKVFEVDSVINNTSSIPEPKVRVHNIVLETDSSSGRSNVDGKHGSGKEVNSLSAMNGSGVTLESSMESNLVASSFQASSNGFNRAFLDFDSSQNLSKEEVRMRDFSPNINGQMNNDYLTLSGAKRGTSPEIKVREATHDMEQISASITKLLNTSETKELPSDLKPLSPTSEKRSLKRASSPTASSKAKEVPKVKATAASTLRSKPSSTLNTTKPQVSTRTTAVRTAVSKPTISTAGTRTTTMATRTVKPTNTTTAMAARTLATGSSTTGARPKSTLPLSKPSTVSASTRPTTRTGVASSLATTKPLASSLRSKVEPRNQVSAAVTSTLPPRVKPVTSTTVTRTLPSKANTSLMSKSTAPLKSSLLSRSSASTSTLKPVTSKIDTGLSSMKTVRMNVPTTSGLKSTSTSSLRPVTTTRTMPKKVESVRPAAATRVSPTKTLTNSATNQKDAWK